MKGTSIDQRRVYPGFPGIRHDIQAYCIASVISIVTMSSFSSLSTAQSQFSNAKLEKIEAAPEAGFHHPYLLLIGEEIKPDVPLLVALPTPQTSDDPADYLSSAERIARNAAPFPAQLSAPILVPVLPRPPVVLPNGHRINLYLPALTRAALEATEKPLARIDLQVLAMIDHARGKLLRERQVEVREKAVFIGFSAAGHFATRIAVLHPERVLAVWAGGIGGHPILPLATHQSRTLTYPVGVADLDQIVGKPFDREAFAEIPMLIVHGAADTNSSLPTTDEPSDSYSIAHARLVFELLGETALTRMEKVEPLYHAAGSPAEFRIYPETAHQITPHMARDLVKFIETQIQAAASASKGMQ
jgi:predicted esterase